jgi:hypothetical protein
MDVLYRELAAGKPPAVALRAAKLSLIESPGNLRKPYYWAPFQLYTVTPQGRVGWSQTKGAPEGQHSHLGDRAGATSTKGRFRTTFPAHAQGLRP